MPSSASNFHDARYDMMLNALYDRQAKHVEGADPVRFDLERDRRILDIARILASRWPRTCKLLHAAFEDRFVLEVAAEIPEYSASVSNISDAVEASASSWLTGHSDKIFQSLFMFESARAGDTKFVRPLTSKESSWLRDHGIDSGAALDLTIDILAIVKSLDFLVARSAPSYLLRNITSKTPTTTVIFERDGNSLAVNLPAEF